MWFDWIKNNKTEWNKTEQNPAHLHKMHSCYLNHNCWFSLENVPIHFSFSCNKNMFSSKVFLHLTCTANSAGSVKLEWIGLHSLLIDHHRCIVVGNTIFWFVFFGFWTPESNFVIDTTRRQQTQVWMWLHTVYNCCITFINANNFVCWPFPYVKVAFIRPSNRMYTWINAI